MKLVALKCEFCGGLLTQVSATNARCRYCNVGYLIDTGSEEPVTVVEEAPRANEEVQRLHELLREHDRQFAKTMRAEGVGKRNGKWFIDSGVAPLPFIFGLLAMLVFAASASPPMAVIGVGFFVIGLIVTGVESDRADRIRIEIGAFYIQREELENALAAAIRQFENRPNVS